MNWSSLPIMRPPMGLVSSMAQLWAGRPTPIGQERRLLHGYSPLGLHGSSLILHSLVKRPNDAMHAYTYRLFFALSLAVAGFAPTAHALDEAQLRDFVLNEVHAGAGRVEVGIDRLAAQLERAPCRRLEPFLSSGARLWGRSTVGVRCADGTRWSTYVPIDVRIYGPALVAARDLNAGETPAPHDVRIEEVELTREPPGLLTDTMQLEHMLVQRTLRAGQPIRTSHLRARPVV